MCNLWISVINIIISQNWFFFCKINQNPVAG